MKAGGIIKLLAVILLLLSACSNYSEPPATPTPGDVQALAAVLSAIDVPVKDYYTYGTTLAAKNCNGWFGSRIARASQNSALSSELGLIGAAAGAAGGPIGAGAAAAMGFGAATLGNIQAHDTVGVDPVVTYGLVRKIQRAWLAAATDPSSKADAYMLVEDFAEKCQLPDIKRAIADAVSTAPVTAVVQPQTFASSIRALPPDIIVGAPMQAAPAHVAVTRQRSAPGLHDFDKRMAWLRKTSMFIPAIDGPRH